MNYTETAIVIPAYCPAAVLVPITDTLTYAGCHVIIVDDGSGEGYQWIFRTLMKRCIVLRLDMNSGKGTAIKTGLLYVASALPECSIIGLMDADGQHTAEDMLHVLETSARHPDALVLGCRDVRKMPIRSHVGNSVTRMAFYHLCAARISDTQTGMRAFARTRLASVMSIQGDRYEYEMNMLTAAVQRQIPVVEVPIETIYVDHQNSTSHFRAIRDSIRIYRRLLYLAVGQGPETCREETV